MDNGYGNVSWWGFSPALDFQEICEIQKLNKDTLNILIVGAGDPRHVLKSISQCHRRKKKNLQFFIIDNCIEIYARYMILLKLAMESTTKISLQERTELFLEIFGNSLIRRSTFNYIINTADHFVRLVTDFSELEKEMPFINLNALKYKEIDGLEAVFKLWRNPKPEAFNIANCWDFRLRQYLGTRYDSKKGVFDWDFNMQLKDRKGGERYIRRGYWGDILTSPYIAYGIECEQEFLEKRNRIYTKTSQDISYHNTLAMFHELIYDEHYKSLNKEQLSSDKENVTELKNEEIQTKVCDIPNTIEEKTDSSVDSYNIKFRCLEINHSEGCEKDYRTKTTINFLPVDSANALINKSKYHHFFDVVYLSNSSTNYFTPEFQEIFADNSAILIETIKFIINLKKEINNAFLNEIKNVSEKMKTCQIIGNPNLQTDAHIQLSYSRKKNSL
ncbi:dynein axonemal assembly factor 3 isoform X2 [Centruroides vittatus]|uniref:dynein axonemal assembly factor 3 isoform X2 n=1 Tax=Centruroides vittatus TaxID=120091 RepID=UPI003510C556